MKQLIKKLQLSKQALLNVFEHASQHQHDDSLGFSITDQILKNAYDYGRINNLANNKYYLGIPWDKEEETKLKKHFVGAMILLNGYLPGIISTCTNSSEDHLYTMKKYASSFQFFHDDIIPVYMKSLGSEKVPEIISQMMPFEARRKNIVHKIQPFLGSSNMMPYKSEKPDLKGVPESHNWWTKEDGLAEDDSSDDEDCKKEKK
uniref:Uncharacterized protein n=1 Tax=Panagrolaimus sp. ES5 TaxID=591445 RepID=A0AC34F0J4_9BILA